MTVNLSETSCEICFAFLNQPRLTDEVIPNPLDDSVVVAHDPGTARAHIYHLGCLFYWMRQRNTCPECREEGIRDKVYALVQGDEAVAIQNRIGQLKELLPRRDGPIRISNLMHYRLQKEFAGTARVVSEAVIGFASEDAVIDAVKSKELDRLRELLTDGSISEFGRGRAVCLAAKGGLFSVVSELLNHGPIPDISRRCAKGLASQYGHLAILDLL